MTRFTEKLNTPVQGTGADGLKRAMGLLWERRGVMASVSPRPTLWPLLLMPLLSAVWLSAALLDIQEGRQLTLVAMFEIVLLVALGPRLIRLLLAPWIMDLSLRWLYRMTWVVPEELPEHLRQFVRGVVEREKLKFPDFGMIDDGAPQAHRLQPGRGHRQPG